MKKNKCLSCQSDGESPKAQYIAWTEQRGNERGFTKGPVCGLHDWWEYVEQKSKKWAGDGVYISRACDDVLR